MKIRTMALLTGVALLGMSACDDKPAPTLAPEASSLAPAKPAALTATSHEFTVAAKGTKVDFMMEAPKEKIRGRVEDASSGKVQVDLKDLTKTTAFLKVDISGIELYQQLQNDDGTFGEEEKSDAQNEHAKNWLEIGPETPAAARTKNSNVEFVIKEVTADKKDVTAMKGAERKVKLTVKGDFLLHGRKSEKSAELEVTFTFAGDKPVSMVVKTVKPFAVGLAEHEVRPRDAGGKLLAKTLDILSPKVAKEALVSIDFKAEAGAAAAPAGAKGDDKQGSKY